MSCLKSRRGIALIVSMIFVLVFSALGLAMAAMSGANVQVANNHRKVNLALGSAESGLEVMRYWLDPVMMPSSTPTSDWFNTIVDVVQDELASNSVYNVTLADSGYIAPVTLDSSAGSSFRAFMWIDPSLPAILNLYVRGSGGNNITRRIRTNFIVGPYEHPIFNYGLATKGPINFVNNPTLTGVTDNWEADIYVEASGAATAVTVGGNTNFDGNINIGNPVATVDFQGDVQIAGDHGQPAIDNHVTFGADAVDFPTPDANHFLPYVTGPTMDGTEDLTKGITLANMTIPAGMDPNFEGAVTINGILFVEPPNTVNFGSNVTLNGIIVAAGDLASPGSNSLTFGGNFDTGPYPPDPIFDPIRHETGSSIIAPGFSASFEGNFSTLEGVMAVSGIHFSANCTALIKGTIVNYSDSPAVVEGNVTMNFDRINASKIPAGFDTFRVLHYDPSSYDIVH